MFLCSTRCFQQEGLGTQVHGTSPSRNKIFIAAQRFGTPSFNAISKQHMFLEKQILL
jgi:hypothetical protein